MAWSTKLLAYALLAAPLGSGILGAYGQDNTQCASTELDWYKNVVGETPCTTYQRLRQICNNDYTVPKFRTLTPGDNCNDQVSECCCNSVSWALSMLCFNCQYDAATQTDGKDAGAGGYGLYLASCSAPKNQTLPNDIQTAVCNKDIKLDRNLYSLFWGDGSWFYTYTKQTMQKDFAVTNNNTFTKCASTTVNTTTKGVSSGTSTGSSPLATDSDSSSKSHSGSGAIIGGAVGGVLGGLLIAGLAFCLWRRRNRGPVLLDLSKEYNGTRGDSEDGGSPQTGMITPFSPTNGPSHRSLPPSSVASGPSASGMYSGIDAHSTFLSPIDDGERHEDAGPPPHLQRSASGRLPPAYREEWEGSDAPPPPPLGGSPGGSTYVSGSGYGYGGYGFGPGSTVGSSVVGGSEGAGAHSTSVPVLASRSAYLRDVKAPLAPSNA